jgi:hypothetical protein
LLRSNLPKTTTPVTLESFTKWKQDRVLKKQKQEEELQKQREDAIKAGKSIGASGRELFTFNPSLLENMEDDDEAMDFDYKLREDSDDEGEQLQRKDEVEVDESAFLEEDLDGLDLDE